MPPLPQQPGAEQQSALFPQQTQPPAQMPKPTAGTKPRAAAPPPVPPPVAPDLGEAPGVAAGGLRPKEVPVPAQQSQQPQGDWQAALPAVAQKYGLQEDLIRRVIRAESAGNPAAISPKGAIGLMQLMPHTAQGLGVDPNDPLQNLDGGARELKRLLDKYQHYGKALAAYNWGEANVDKLASTPGGFNNLPAETQQYIHGIMDGYQLPQQAQQVTGQAAQPTAAAATQPQSPQPSGPDQSYQQMLQEQFPRSAEAMARPMEPSIPVTTQYGSVNIPTWHNIQKGLLNPGGLLSAFGLAPPTSEQYQGQQDLQRGVQEEQAWAAQHPEAQQANRGFWPPKGGLQMAPPEAAPHMAAYWQNPTAANLKAIPEEKPFSPTAAGMVQPGTVGAGVAEGVAGLASPANIMQLAAVPMNKVMNLAYTGMMGKDTVQLIYQAKQQEAAGNPQAAHELYGQALVTGGMTLLTALGLRPEKVEGMRPGTETSQPGVTPGPRPAEVQVGPGQERALGVEGGPRPVTSPGISGGREIGGDTPRAAISAPIEQGGGQTAGTVTPKPSGSGGVGAYIGRARAEGRLPDLRKREGQAPEGMAERRESYLDQATRRPPVRPTPEQVAQQAAAQASQQPPVQKPLVQPQLSPEALAKEQRAGMAKQLEGQITDRRGGPSADLDAQIKQATEIASAAQAAGHMDLAQRATAMAQELQRTKESTSAQRPSGGAQAPTPAPTEPVRRAESPAQSPDTAREPLRAAQEPVRGSQPVAAKPKPYTALPPEQRPRVPARPQEPLRPEQLGPEPQVKAGMSDQQKKGVAVDRDAYLKQRAQTAPTKEALLEATRGPAATAAATLDRTLTRHLKSTDENRPGRHAELDKAIEAERAKGPEAAQAAAQAMTERAQRAEGRIKTVEHLLSKPTQEWDKVMRGMLHEPLTESVIDPESGVAINRLARTPDGAWITREGVKGGVREKGRVRRNLDAIAAEIFNDLRGNTLREVGRERQVQLDPEGQATLADRQAKYQELLKQVRGQEGHRPSDEQLAQMKDLMGDIHALRQTRMVAESGPGSEPEGTRATNKFWKSLMGRSDKGHTGKPSPDLLKIRLEELRQEAAKAREVAQKLQMAPAPVTEAEAPKLTPGVKKSESTAVPTTAADSPGHGREAARRFKEEGVKGLEKLSPTELKGALQNEISPTLRKALNNEIEARRAGMTPSAAAEGPRAVSKGPERPVEAPKTPAKAPAAPKAVEPVKTAPKPEAKPSDERSKLLALQKNAEAKLAALAPNDPARPQIENILKQVKDRLEPVRAPESPRTPAQQLTRMVGEERPKASPQAQASYAAERERVVEQYAADRKAHLAKKDEVQRLRSVDPKDYTPEFVERLAKYGRDLKTIEGQHEFLAKVAEARSAFERGDDRAGSAAVQSALAMADQRLIEPRPGRMPVEPSTGESTIEPAKASKARAAEDAIGRLASRIEAMPAGEDRSNLGRRLRDLRFILEGDEETPGINKKIKMAMQNIQAMKEKGVTERTYTRKTDNAKVTETLGQLEARVRNLGKERMALMAEEIPSIEASVTALGKAPVAPAPAPVPTRTEPTVMPTYGPTTVVRDPITGKYEGTVPGERTGEKIVTPSPAPVEQGVQQRLEQLADMERHLKNAQEKYTTPNRSQAIMMAKLKKGIKSVRASLGKDAPAVTPSAAPTLSGTQLLDRAARTEPRPQQEPEVVAPRAKGYTSGAPVSESAEDLHSWLVSKAESVPSATLSFIDKALPRAGEAGDSLAAAVHARLLKGEFGDIKGDEAPAAAAAKLGQALDVLTKGRVKSLGAEEGQRGAVRAQAFTDAMRIAKGQPRPGQEGFIGKPGKRGQAGAAQALKQAQTKGGQAVRGFMNRILSSAERNREAQNLNNRKEDLRQMNKADVFHYWNIERELRLPPKIRAKIHGFRDEQNLPVAKRQIQLTPAEHKINDWVTSIISDNVRIRQKLGGRGFTPEEIAVLSHRVPAGKGQTYEKWLKGKQMVSSGNIFSTAASSRYGAKYVALEEPGGDRIVVRVAKSGNVYAYGAGKRLGGPIGLKSELENAGLKFKRATTDEAEVASGRKYMRDAIGPNIAENIALRRAERAHDFVEKLKQEPEFQRMATRNKEVGQALGFREARVMGREHLPQFKGYWFEPHIAEVLEKEYAKFQKGDFSAYERANNWLKRSIFWNPLIHTPNIAIHWQGEKGLMGMATQLFDPREWRAHQHAFQVLTDPVKYHQMLEAGLPLMRQPNFQDVTNLFVTHATKDISLAPANSRLDRLAKSMGYVDGRDMAKKVLNPFKGASEITWASHDYAILQATFSRMEKHGWDLKTAAEEVTKHIPNYRMPPRVWNNRMLGALMDTPGLSMFSQYHYGAFRSYGEMAKELVNPLKPGDRLRALDRMAALGLITYVLYPQMDKLAKHLTGRSTAQWRRAGSSTFVYNVGRLYNSLMQKQGPKMAPVPFAESVVTPAPLISTAIKAVQAKELTQKGQPLVGTLKKPGVAIKAGQIALESLGPITGYESGQTHPGKGSFDWREFLYRMVGGRDEMGGGVTQPGARMPGLPRGPRIK